MYSHHLSSMANYLIQDGLIKPEEKKDAILAMAKTWSDKMAISWCIGDIHAATKSLDMTLTDDQAKEVLDDLCHDHDASLGVNWTGIETYLMQHDFGE